MPTINALLIALEKDAYDGMVVNPAGNALPLPRKVLELMLMMETGSGPAMA